jgi:hypothetical protein
MSKLVSFAQDQPKKHEVKQIIPQKDSSWMFQPAAFEQIKLAMKNSVSQEDGPRTEASTFLTKQCEPDPQFQLALIHVIRSFQG